MEIRLWSYPVVKEYRSDRNAAVGIQIVTTRTLGLSLLIILGLAGCRGVSHNRPGWQVRGLGVQGIDPDFDKSGKVIAFTQRSEDSAPGKPPGGASWVCLIGVDGKGYRKLVEGENPSWSPNGKIIAFFAPGRSGIYNIPGIYEIESGKAHCYKRCPTGGSRLYWTPYGSGVVYAGMKPSLFRGDEGFPVWWFLSLRQTTDDWTEVAYIRESEVSRPIHFSFGMQGAAFAWSFYGTSDSPTIEIRYGVETYRGVTIPMLPGERSNISHGTGDGPQRPAWHPREPVLLFDAYGCVWKMDVPKQIVSLFWRSKQRSGHGSAAALAPSYSPEGDRVAFLTIDKGRGQILCTDSHGKGQRVAAGHVLPNEFEEGVFTWGPDSNHIVFIAENGELRVAWRGR